MLVSDRATKFQALWKAVSDVPPPELAQFIRWCLRFDDELLEKAIMKAAAKFHRTGTDSDRAYRYVTKLLFNLLDEEMRAPALRKGNMNHEQPLSEGVTSHLEATYASTPNHYRDIAEGGLRSGNVTTETTISDVNAILAEHNATRQ
ncbi:hypothetical protein SAMN05421771_1851 [Granulicella pectinivorans]|uniref:Uncharacterized protein n=1 Tax=Granulicella pectinivorans TaxID=474950 RepID=A0A1I6M5M2_9BACT|nr:hypothetical protein [Granulicella pectinivorans]SFS10812.1 hypothetical protein SAMN05421771_1851 [Granulicella pectinivorans]